MPDKDAKCRIIVSRAAESPRNEEFVEIINYAQSKLGTQGATSVQDSFRMGVSVDEPDFMSQMIF